MAEFSQYKSESETEKGGSAPSPPLAVVKTEEGKSDGSSSDEVVFLELGGRK